MSEKTEGLDEWESAVIDLFLNAANSLWLAQVLWTDLRTSLLQGSSIVDG